MVVYKYLTPDRVDVLEHSRIRFTQPAALNDPFEMFPCFLQYGPWLLKTAHQRAIDKYGPEAAQSTLPEREHLVVKKLLEFPSAVSKYFVILSLSRIPDNVLMWSHYADSHRGFLIGFDSDHDFLKSGPSKAYFGLKDVEYSDDRYVLKEGEIDTIADPEIRDSFIGVFYRKGTYWKYEQEMRLLALPQHANAVLPQAGVCDVRLFSFPPSCIREVVFGFRMTDETQHRLFDIVRDKFPNATIAKAFPHQSKFGVYIKSFAG